MPGGTFDPNNSSGGSSGSGSLHISQMSGPPPGWNGPAPGHPEFDAYLQEWMAKHNGPLLGMAATSPVHGSRYLVSPAVSALKGQFDGPGSTPSQTGSPRPSPRLSSGSPAGRQNPYAPPSAGPLVNIPNTRVELPSAAYALVNGFADENLKRAAYGSNGKQVVINLNQFKVVKSFEKDVYQYDIQIGTGAEKMGRIKEVWASKTIQNALNGAVGGKAPWLWDGNKIAWTSVPVTENRILVNLTTERGCELKAGKEPDTCYFIIRPTKRIRMASLEAYLSGKMPFDNSVLEGINFLDHLMRQWPASQYTLIKRSFYTRGTGYVQLDNYVSALKGVYSSIRLCSLSPSMGSIGTGLAVNVDVANGTFWTAQELHQAARNFCSAFGNRQGSWPAFRDSLFPVKNPQNGKVTWPEAMKHLHKMTKLKFTVKHRGKNENPREYTIMDFTKKETREGSNAKNEVFPYAAIPGGPVQNISVYDFYRTKYNVQIEHWYLPLVKTTKDGMFPMELCVLKSNQKFQYKLSPEQTQSMINFAVTRPKERLASINNGIKMLGWQQDPYLKHFGVQIDPSMTQTKALVLPPPEVQYDKSKATPGYSGRWDLRGKKFLFPNTETLKSWGVCVVGACLQEAEVRNFMNLFIQTYIGHGGRIENKNPTIYIGQRNQDLGELVVAARKATGDAAKMAPQILFFVLPGRDSFMYERLKRNNECRFALVSQMMNVAHVRKCQPQYCSNVAMKVNAKLGGASCKVVSAKPFFTRPTMIIGADVSHASPGSPQASMAAVTMSFDNVASRYAAAVQTNGYRVEMITETNINHMIMPLFGQWVQRVGGNSLPQHIYYFRDGVSEGQFSKVINEEVAHMKKAIVAKVGPNGANIKFTVVVCTKRHHIRFFPKEGDSSAADKNGNPLPGTLVERDVTHPSEFDFYLSSHSAIQGTARPVHYQVLMDEANVPVNDLQKLIYQHCYQYMRSTTPVSMFPAIYYAHLASNRARCHENVASSDGPRGGQKFEESRRAPTFQTGSSGQPTEALPLLALGNTESGDGTAVKIRTTMWYI